MRNASQPYRVFVVDDSRTIRRLIGAIVEETDGLVLAGSAESAEEAWDVLKNPQTAADVISLDIELPGMNGIEFLRRLMAVRPIPVLVVSGHTDASADLTLTALETGAIDCIQKPDGRPQEIDRFIADTRAGLIRAAQSNQKARGPSLAVPARAARPAGPALAVDPDTVICIGASTGGVPAVCKVVAGLAGLGAPILVVQHMPPSFTGRLAARLAQTTGLPSQEARDGDRLAPGSVWVAPGGSHMRLVRKAGGYFASLAEEQPVSGHMPSIDVLFESAARQAGGNAVGVILTGMGRDGADGLLSMRNAGSPTFAQDEATSVVFGMPKAAAQIGAVEQMLPLDRIADAVAATLTLSRPDRPRRISQGARYV
ncbi:chemotaxis-specific protein-glutamate methyltransferase CheB [Alsobacter sp. SYSU M60028]|uniref:Protein-glutamate methylesterase/protein-glutamine glutaminase n=1 Tax=Alsobacter ponti TaxID=2962936 RepID=A0ABT1L8J6_9HYPH|nr:chemotaxis-specific protein-glutamate methyltransferase CheB [Alsobacter ponti]MCP8937827.1 chemotaxis-specific protein-glutamate methyltransferase CheB [Alsobacter ponti]